MCSCGRVLVAFLLALAVSATASPDTWHEVRTQHFVVFSNAGEKSAKRVAHDFEQIRVVKEKHLLTAIGLDRDFGAAFVSLAYYYAGVDSSLARALAMVRNAANRDPASGAYRLLVARVLLKMGRLEEAHIHAERAVRIAVWSHHGAESNNVCWFGSLTGFADRVMAACEFAVQQNPDYGGFRDSRGLARALSGDRAGALEDFRSFIQEDDVETSR